MPLTLSPISAQVLPNSLSLSPRLKLLLTFFRVDAFVKPINEWQLNRSLLDFLSASSSPLIPVADEDLVVAKLPDLHKRKQSDPVAEGVLYVRELGFLEKGDGDVWRRFGEWRRKVVEKLDGMEMNLEGVKFEVRVRVPEGDDFEMVKMDWEGIRSVRRPDTIIVRGLPSRWFAEPRVSSKPSMLVSHTIFSALGKIRNLNVAADDHLGKKGDEKVGEIVSGLNCKIWVQFESYDDFSDAMKALCGRSLQKEGSRLKVDYEVTWDKDGFFRNPHQGLANRREEKRDGHVPILTGNVRNETRRFRSEALHSDSSRQPKRFRD